MISSKTLSCVLFPSPMRLRSPRSPSASSTGVAALLSSIWNEWSGQIRLKLSGARLALKVSDIVPACKPPIIIWLRATAITVAASAMPTMQAEQCQSVTIARQILFYLAIASLCPGIPREGVVIDCTLADLLHRKQSCGVRAAASRRGMPKYVAGSSAPRDRAQVVSRTDPRRPAQPAASRADWCSRPRLGLMCRCGRPASRCRLWRRHCHLRSTLQRVAARRRCWRMQ
ncbi:hypothetical protein SAMN04488135_106226 [Pollutimonas bauzanensis]|uniref:Uncharacterized protein n=1 Tax=Pollutimonas bauzanensis TaxID=658167 RepID=A0A1M5X932_9BURK|nr:hypothetical protein SAMN04488135_106226 [Pollutimonas bauzanensis]